jgi:hypothetical protein
VSGAELLVTSVLNVLSIVGFVTVCRWLYRALRRTGDLG